MSDSNSPSFSLQAPPKKVPKTIESMRVYDETMVDPEDEEASEIYQDTL